MVSQDKLGFTNYEIYMILKIIFKIKFSNKKGSKYFSIIVTYKSVVSRPLAKVI
jgi:hypothetical protein